MYVCVYGLIQNITVSLLLFPQYVFVSLLSRDSVYDVLRRICTHLQVGGLGYRGTHTIHFLCVLCGVRI